MLKSNRRGAAGQQYAIMVGLVAVVGLLAVGTIGSNTSNLFSATSNRMQAAANGTAAVPLPSGPTSPPPPPPPTTLTPGNTTLVAEYEGIKARCTVWSGSTCQLAEINFENYAPFNPTAYPSGKTAWYRVQNCYTNKAFCYYATAGNDSGSCQGNGYTPGFGTTMMWQQGPGWNDNSNNTSEFSVGTSVTGKPWGFYAEFNRTNVNYSSTYTCVWP